MVFVATVLPFYIPSSWARWAVQYRLKLRLFLQFWPSAISRVTKAARFEQITRKEVRLFSDLQAQDSYLSTNIASLNNLIFTYAVKIITSVSKVQLRARLILI